MDVEFPEAGCAGAEGFDAGCPEAGCAGAGRRGLGVEARWEADGEADADGAGAAERMGRSRAVVSDGVSTGAP
ncbi:hypothetical protein [Streptomyces cyanogenus]|uniref:hypothetical protein n=1 Tax=Streptomyces cyanogenus TaxID=80860 RepID=UPI001AA117F4|nr:hypothetical protein [Streptomyces cyanogenus]